MLLGNGNERILIELLTYSNRIINLIVIEHKFFHTFDKDYFIFVSDELKPNNPFIDSEMFPGYFSRNL